MAAEWQSGGDCFNSGAFLSINGVHGAPHCPRGGGQVPLKGKKGCLHSYPARPTPNSFGREE